MPGHSPNKASTPQPVQGLDIHCEKEFDGLLADAIRQTSQARAHALLELDVVRADDIEHRFGEDAAAALRRLLASQLYGVLGGETPVCNAGHCGLIALLRDTPCERACAVAHQLRGRVERSVFHWHEHPFRLGSHVAVLELGPQPASPHAWRRRSREVSLCALELGGDGVQLLGYSEHALAEMQGEQAWHERLTQIIA